VEEADKASMMIYEHLQVSSKKRGDIPAFLKQIALVGEKSFSV
jgi:hypothetical protein